MSLDELALVGDAVKTAARLIDERGGITSSEVPFPEEVLSSIEDSHELIEVGEDWVREAEDEVERRRLVLQNEIDRRRKNV